jgi:hypothetical protein
VRGAGYGCTSFGSEEKIGSVRFGGSAVALVSLLGCQCLHLRQSSCRVHLTCWEHFSGLYFDNFDVSYLGKGSCQQTSQNVRISSMVFA